tara:strand:- start:561 stop:731 length:171 start_codon:yes stop_codon:yes gene_type:complete
MYYAGLAAADISYLVSKFLSRIFTNPAAEINIGTENSECVGILKNGTIQTEQSLQW